MKITFILKEPDRDTAAPVMRRIFEALRRRSLEVDTIVPAGELIELSCLQVGSDLYALRPGVELGLSLAGILHDKGARIVNSFPASEFTADKARVTALLEANGVPTPRSYIAGGSRAAVDCLARGPAIVKPHRGSAGEGVRVVKSGAEIDDRWREPLYLQQLLPCDGEDLKVYVIGREIFAIKRAAQARSYQEKQGRRCVVTPLVADLALRCGDLLGLEIYGVDFLETDAGPVAVDVNYLPGMIGVQEAPERIAEYLYQACQGRDAGRPRPEAAAPPARAASTVR